MAFTNVSTVLTVNDTARIIITIDKNSALSFKRIEKNAKSGLTFGLTDVEIKPLNPVKKTIGIHLSLAILFIFGFPQLSTTVILIQRLLAIHINKLCSHVPEQETNIY